MKRKILWLFLALVLCFSLLTIAVCATETDSTEGSESTGEVLTWNQDEAYASGCSSKFSWTLDLDTDSATLTFNPIGSTKTISTQAATQKSNGVVTNRANGAFAHWRETYPDYVKAVTKIVIGEGITTIQWQHNQSLFSNWPNLHTVDLGGVTTIGGSSYNHASNDGEKNIAKGAMFYNSPKLTTVYGNGNEQTANVVNLSNLNFAVAYTKTNMNNTRYLLYGCKAVTNFVFPTSVDPYVHVGMFYDCSSLKSIEIPTWATEIKENAFYGCSALESITIPANVTAIASNALTGCSKLTSITFENPNLDVSKLTIPDNENIVINCSSVAQATALNAKGLSSATVNLEMEGNFLSDESGFAYVLEGGVLTISKADTTTVAVLSTDLDLGLGGVVKKVIIEEDSGITAIDADFFKSWIASTVVIPSTLTKIGAASFANMANLTTVVNYTAYTADNTAGAGIINLLGITTVADDSFSGSSAAGNVTVYMGKSLAAPFTAFSWFADDATVNYYVYPTSKTATYFRANNIAFSYLTVEQTGDENLVRSGTQVNSNSGNNAFDWSFDEATGVLTYSKNASGSTEFNWRDYTMNEIKPWKQTWRDAIKRIVVSGFTSRKLQRNYGAYESPFSNMPNLESVHLACYSSNMYITFYAKNTNGWFENCPKLTTVSYGSDDTIDNEIDLSNWGEYTNGWYEMFKGCTSITKVIFPAKLKNSTSNGNYPPAVFSGMFEDCTSLTSLVLPSYFTNIETNGFANCSNMKEITITNSEMTIADATVFPDQDGLVIICASQTQYDAIVGFGYEKTKAVLAVSGNLLADGTGFSYMIRENHDTVGEDSGYTLLVSKATATVGTSLSADNIPSEYLTRITQVVIEEASGVSAVSESFFSAFPALNTVAIPSTLKALGAKSLASLPLLNTVALYNDFYDASFAGEGIIDLRSVTTLAPDVFADSFASAEPTIYLAKTAAISGELDWVSAESNGATIYTYPSGTAAAALRASNAENIIHKYYTAEMTGDNTLLREDEAVGSSFKWSFDETTGKLIIMPKAGLTASNTTNFTLASDTTVWKDWKATWTDAIESIYVMNFGGDQIYYQHHDSAFSNLPNLKHVHIGRSKYRLTMNSYGVNGLFENCKSLTTVSYGSDDTYDGVIDLRGWNIQDVNMDDMFYGCESVTKILLPSELSKNKAANADIIIASKMFYGCKNLTDIVITKDFGGIGANAFYGCDKLTRIVIENPSFDVSSANATTFTANEGLVIHATSYAVSEALGELGYTVENINGAIKAEGFSIRYTGYNGLRGIFSFNETVNKNVEKLGYTLKEYGVVVSSASEYDSWGGIDVKLRNGAYVTEATAIKKLPIYMDGQFVGKVLSSTVSGERVDFACAVVNYEANHKKDVYMTAYVVYTDADGFDYVLYDNYVSSEGYSFFNLYDITLSMFKNASESGILSAGVDELAVWNTLLQGADTSVKETALEGYEGVTVTLVRSASDSDTYIPFVRSENGEAITDEMISAAEAVALSTGFTLGETLAVTIADQGSVAPEYKESIDYASTITTPNRYPRYATPDPDQKYGAQHLQGMTSDDDGNVYYSLTNLIVKVNQKGEEVGVYKSASKWISDLSMHIGNIYWHDGKIYIGLGISKTTISGGKRYIGVLDDSVFDAEGGFFQDSDENAALKAVCINDISYDKNFVDSEGVSHSKFGGGGIDGITVGQLPGKGYILPAGYTLKEDVIGSDGKLYTAGTVLNEELEVEDKEYYLLGVRTLGSYDTYRFDDDNQQIMVFDFDDIVDGENLTPMSYARVASEYDADIIDTKLNMFVYTGYHEYGCQVICYDKSTGDILMWPYDRASKNNEFPNDNFNVIDGSKKLYLDVVEVGQSVPETSEFYESASDWASYYTDDEDLDNDGDTTEQLLGWHMTLKCVCGKLDIENHDEVIYGDTGYAVKYCGSRPGLAGDNGCISLGGDYFYVAAQSNTEMYRTDGTTTQTAYGGQARLYKISRYHGAWSFVRVN